jgi:hypothetical protein
MMFYPAKSLRSRGAGNDCDGEIDEDSVCD